MPSNGAALTPVERFFQFSVLGLLASGYFAVVGSGYLDLPTIAFMAAALLFRSFMAAGLIRYEVPPRLVTLLTLVYVAFYALDYLYLSRTFVPATVHLVFFLAIVKVLTATTNRDYFYLKLLAFLELLAACILSSSINFFVFLVLFLLLGVATFTSSEIRRSSQQTTIISRTATARGIHWRLAAGSVLVSSAILTLTGGLFFVLPRTARAAFQHLVSNRYHVPGFSDTVTLGEIGEIKQSNTPVMHIRMDSPSEPTYPPLKWRGASLSDFDGHRWFNQHEPETIIRPDRNTEFRLVDPKYRTIRGQHISYSVQLRDIASNVLFFAGRPEFVRIDVPVVLRSPSGAFKFVYRDPGTLSYVGFSFVEGSGGDADPDPEPLNEGRRAIYTHLPTLDPRIRPLAQSIAALEVTDAGRARAIEKYLRTSYGYTLELPPTEPPDPLANFLFERHKGHCEYFASAMAVMLRTIHIPSRVVTGFGPGVYNPVSGLQVIRASDAHSWVEAWLPRHGWTTFDPTPPDLSSASPSLWAHLMFYLDAADTFWQDWVLNYNVDRQLQLASSVGESSERVRASWIERTGAFLSTWKTTIVNFGRDHAFGIVVTFLLIVLPWRFGKVWLHWLQAERRVRKVSRGEVRASDATVLYLRLLKLLKSRGFEKPAWLTPMEFARVIPESELSLLVQDFTESYNHLRFGADTEAAARMMGIIERLSTARG
ncbi:MAG TPA: DUF3488 and transglutaminase-like domain-containing protein [Bryobacteraceae bacterium]|nr:DUF3488 and transglutaminase-like domain-containing protein [Bryobacteraceae bacterium]